MKRQLISIDQFNSNSISLWQNQWLALVSGDFTKNDYNAMTVAWGSIGCMWNKPFAQIVVRPGRYTYEFLEKYATFTLNVFPEDYKKALQILGSKSGRDGDKIAETGLTLAPAQQAAAPVFQEAELVFECKKIYFQDMNPGQFIDPKIDKNYPQKDYHRIYFGEILALEGVEKYAGIK